MDTILEYIMSNYTLILGVAIVILLAIIGSYADKTNFGQGKGKKVDEDKKGSEDLEKNNMNVPINELIGNNNKVDVSVEENKNSTPSSKVDIKTEKDNNTDSNIQSVSNDSKESLDVSFEKLDEEFNEILPQKELFSDDLLDEIESISLDKTQKIDLDDIPDLDDLELPKIKELNSDKDKDIWDF